jgi:hypothetical protein
MILNWVQLTDRRGQSGHDMGLQVRGRFGKMPGLGANGGFFSCRFEQEAFVDVSGHCCQWDAPDPYSQERRFEAGSELKMSFFFADYLSPAKEPCEVCQRHNRPSEMLLCDGCDCGE